MRTNLKVPFAEKDEAKRLGARWDPANKVWYVKDVADLSAFARWSPAPAEAQQGTAPKPATRSKTHFRISHGESGLALLRACVRLSSMGRLPQVSASRRGQGLARSLTPRSRMDTCMDTATPHA